MLDKNTLTAVETQAHELARSGFSHTFGRSAAELQEDREWKKLRGLGTRLWLDTGDIEEAAKLFTREFDALTTNNTLLNKEVQKGLYDDLVPLAAQAIRDAAPDIDQQTLVLEVAFVLNANHALKLVSRFDANVSVELHTDLADDVDGSYRYGKRYFAICPERFIVKVPLSPAGLIAARRLSDDGVPVNFTLGFSARQNCLASQLAQPAYVNVFMGRLGAFVADNALGTGDNVGEKATLAAQRELVALRQAKRAASLLIGASMRSPDQVPALAGLDVYTMPTKVAAGYRERPLATLESQVGHDPPVACADGVKLADFACDTLWDVSDAFRAAVDELVEKDAKLLTPDEVIDHFDRPGTAGFMCRWSEADLALVKKDGKIPVFEHWKDRLASGKVGLDALMNISALHAFVTDQEALDDRIRSLI